MMQFLAIFDRKAGSYSPAICYPDLATAERAFIGLLADPHNTVSQWPDDFCLYHVGTYNPADGSVLPLAKPVCVLTGQQALTALASLRRKLEAGGAVGEDSSSPKDKANECSPDAVSPDKETEAGSSLVSDSASYRSTPDML